MAKTNKIRVLHQLGLLTILAYLYACSSKSEIQLQQLSDIKWPDEMSGWKANSFRLDQTNLHVYAANLKVDSLIADLFSTKVLPLNANGILSPEVRLPKIESKVNTWSELAVEENETGQTRHILKGSTTHLEYFEVNGITINSNQKPPITHATTEVEELIIIKQGQLAITIENKSKILGPGSVALIMPGDRYEIENIRDTPATYYSLKYRSKLPMDLERGEKAGGSFVVDWNEVEYREHNKGGRRDVFDRPTAMCKDFEMHVTNLNEDIQSHPPHTHVVEEIILMIIGNIDMHIDGSEYPATTGDLSFLDSNIPHAPTNTGKGQCMYFAFQWK